MSVLDLMCLKPICFKYAFAKYKFVLTFIEFGLFLIRLSLNWWWIQFYFCYIFFQEISRWMFLLFVLFLMSFLLYHYHRGSSVIFPFAYVFFLLFYTNLVSIIYYSMFFRALFKHFKVHCQAFQVPYSFGKLLFINKTYWTSILAQLS